MMDTLDKLVPALIKFQSVVKPPAKTKTNPHLQNKYADLADIIDVIREPLSQNGFAFTQMVNGGTLITILMHESGQSLTAETSLMLDKQTMQGMGSAITYARRYALSAILGIAAEDDDDGNGASSARNVQSQANTPANKTKPDPAKSGAKNEQGKLLFKAKIDGEYKFMPIEQTPLEQLEWYAANSNIADLKAAAAEYLAKLKEKANDPQT